MFAAYEWGFKTPKSSGVNIFDSDSDMDMGTLIGPKVTVSRNNASTCICLVGEI